MEKGEPTREVLGDHRDRACNVRRTNVGNPSRRGEPAQDSLDGGDPRDGASKTRRTRMSKPSFVRSLRWSNQQKANQCGHAARRTNPGNPTCRGEPARERLDSGDLRNRASNTRQTSAGKPSWNALGGLGDALESLGTLGGPFLENLP